MLSYLQSLTDHRLRVNAEGIVYIAYYATSDFQFAHGNALISRLIASKHVVTIMLSTGTGENFFAFDLTYASTPGVGTGGTIFFDPTSREYTYSVLRSFSTRERMPVNMVLAHELIHADRATRGVIIPLDQTENITIRVPRGTFNPARLRSPMRYVTRTVLLEEWATIGLGHNVAGDITENMIRREHSLPRRTIH